MKSNKVILGVLGGIAAGALLGVLYAPEKGSKTRKKIKSKSSDYAEELKDKVDTALEVLSKKYETLKSEGKELFAEGKSKLKKDIESMES